MEWPLCQLYLSALVWGSGLEAQLLGSAAEERRGKGEGELGNTFSCHTCDLLPASSRACVRALASACAQRGISQTQGDEPGRSAHSSGIVRCPCVSPNHVHEVVRGQSNDGNNKASSVAVK